ncbi:MAG: hypothetical protein ABI165_02070, partial [Bryobacteraceae bacterium]
SGRLPGTAASLLETLSKTEIHRIVGAPAHIVKGELRLNGAACLVFYNWCFTTAVENKRRFLARTGALR